MLLIDFSDSSRPEVKALRYPLTAPCNLAFDDLEITVRLDSPLNMIEIELDEMKSTSSNESRNAYNISDRLLV